MQLTRRHRAVSLALALVVAGTFFLFLTSAFLERSVDDEPRICALSPLYRDVSFTEMQQLYHWTTEVLIEERMHLYEGTVALQCSAETLDRVIQPGIMAYRVAQWLPSVDATELTYDQFQFLLSEWWRTYDCHLYNLEQDVAALFTALGTTGSSISAYTNINVDIVAQEREQARLALDRALFLLRSSEQYLPLHATLRCLQRGSIDVRNAMALLSDANQCAAVRLPYKQTSILQP